MQWALRTGRLRQTVKALLYHGGYYHAYRALDRWRHPGRRLLILVYHNLCDPDLVDAESRALLELRPVLGRKVFESHLEVIRRIIRVVSLEEGARELEESPQAAEISLAITFDDGYASFETVAAPLLRKYGFAATVFLPTAYIDDRRPFWWDRLALLIQQWDPARIPVASLAQAAGMEVPSEGHSFMTPRDSKQYWLETLERYLAKSADRVRVDCLDALARLLSFRGEGIPMAFRSMTWDAIRTLQTQGMSFGAHTQSHVNMACAPRNVLESEILGSARRISVELNRPTTLFAYPYGLDVQAYSQLCPLLVRAGIRYARTMRYGVNDAGSDVLLLSRAELGERDHRFELERDLLLSSVERS